MIICPSCNHQNPEGSLQCENCYTPLPTIISCPNCGASVQNDATFCGQCGFNLQAENSSTVATVEEIGSLPDLMAETSLPEEIPLSQASEEILPETTTMSSFIQSPWDDEEEQTTAQPQSFSQDFPEMDSTQRSDPPATETEFAQSEVSPDEEITVPWGSSLELNLDTETTPAATESLESDSEEIVITTESNPPQKSSGSQSEPTATINSEEATQIQIQTASLLHLQSNTTIEIPYDLNVVHLGKPNVKIPPDLDLSGFPDSEVVSRIHADIRIEGDVYYIEDTGSSNGTYINHTPLLEGNRHRLRGGDRIALGKGDLVTFIFQLS